MGRLAAAALWLLAAAAPLHAEPKDAQNPAPINAFELEAGRRFDFNPGAKDESNFRLTYKGQLVREQGTPFKFAAGLDLTAPTLPSVEGAGDRNRWALRYENRSAVLGGSLLEAQGVQPLVLAGIEKLDLRGAAAVASDERGTHVQVGLESPPLRIPGLRGREVSNWIVLGVNGQRNPAAAGGVMDTQYATYRVFVGKAFGWRKSADVGKTAARIEQQVLTQAATLDEAKVLARKIRAAAKTGTPSNLQTLLLDAVDAVGSDADWQRAVRAAAVQEADSITDQPTVALYAESSGGVSVNGRVEGRRWRNLLTANVDYWFLPGRDDTFVRLRYEHGYEWTAPQAKRKQLFVTLAVRM
jgi:hypothetical protein